MKKLLSMILTMLMLLSVICIAPVSVSATEVEVAQTGVTMTGGEVLYFIPSSNWKVENARFAAYFYGSGNAWVSCTEVEGEDNLYSVTVPAGSWTNVIFCRMNPYSATNDWNNKWNQSADLTFDGTNNCWANVEGSWDGSQGTWSVYTPPVVEEPEVPDVPEEPELPATFDEVNVYFVDYAYNFSEVYAYAWTTTDNGDDIAVEWPGIKMTATGESLSIKCEQSGGLVYSAAFTKEYENIIFVGKYDSSDELAQTADLTFEADKYCYWGNEAWYDSIADIESDFPVTDDNATVTIFFQNNWMWTDINIYCWDADYNYIDYSWPGTSMAYYDNDGTYDIYSFNLPTNVAGFLISGIKDDGSSALDKTPDITEGFYDGICYWMTWDNGNKVGSEDISVILPDMGGEEEEVTETSLEGLSVTLGGKIGYNLHFKISSDIMADPSARLVVYRNSEPWYELPATEFDYYDEERELYVFTIELAAKEMTDTIASKVITDDYNTFFNVNSLAGYCQRILEDPVKYAREQDLVKAMLNYGTASQIYFNYNTDLYANYDLSDEDKVVPVYDYSDFAPVIEGEADAVEFYGAALILESDTYLKFYFKVDESQLPEGAVPGITINGLHGAAFERNGNLWSFTIYNIAAHELSTEFVLEMGNGYTVTYSANSYIYLAQQSGKTELVNLANALGAYSYAAGLYGSK